MNPKDRQNIITNIELLSNSIELTANLLNQLINKNIFTQQMIEDIKKIDDEMERRKRFLVDLTRRGPNAVDKFVEVLYGVDQISAARLLRPDSLQKGLTEEQVIENIVSNSPPDASEDNIDYSLASGDCASRGHTVSSIENEDYMVTVQKCKKSMVGPNIYRMTSGPRGFCLIFNNIEFVNDCYLKRLGSEAEANRLRDVFSQLHFTVEVITNSTKEQMLSTIQNFSKKADLRRHDALIFIVLSHGLRHNLITSDGCALMFEDVIAMWNNENCPLLINKPKVFFFNCCRGDSVDSGPKFQLQDVDMNAVADARMFPPSKVPTANDMLICFSTIDGYVSWRNEENGSWFGTALSQALMKHSHDKELHHILITAYSLMKSKVTKDGEVQVIEHTSRGFSKLFYFNPGIVNPTNPSNGSIPI